MTVIGMGENKTPKAFRVACDRFTSLEILLDPDAAEKEASAASNKGTKTKGSKAVKVQHTEPAIDKRTIENVIIGIITENDNDGKPTGLGEIGSTLVKMYPEFDVRNYGYSLLSKFLEEFSSLRLKKVESTVTVELMENADDKNRIEQYAVECVKEKGESGMLLGDLSNKLHLKYRNFNVRDYGYSTFSKYIQSIPHLTVTEDKNKEKEVRYEE